MNRSDRPSADLITTVSAAIGAVTSIALVLFVGRRNPSTPLLALFAIWVTVPFAMIAVLARSRAFCAAKGRLLLRWASVAILVCSIAIYASAAISSAYKRGAAPFVLMPAASIVAIILVAIFAKRSQ